MRKFMILFGAGFIAALLLSAFLSAKPAGAAGPNDCNAQADLSGSISLSSDGNTATALIHNSSTSCTYKVGLAAYREYHQDDPDSQDLVNQQTDSIKPGADMLLTVQLPTCKAQIDAFWGELILKFKGDRRYNDRLITYVHTSRPFCDAPGGSVTPAGNGTSKINAVPPHTVPDVIPTPVSTKKADSSTDTGTGGAKPIIPGLPNTGEGGWLDLSNPDNLPIVFIAGILVLLGLTIIVGVIRAILD